MEMIKTGEFKIHNLVSDKLKRVHLKNNDKNGL